MKLIRLTAKDDNVFNNNFQADLQLNENSQIALLNASFEKKQITYTTSNDVFNYTIDTPNTNTEELNVETYGKTNIISLLRDIELKLNLSLNTAYPSQSGMGWLVDTNSDNKVTIKTFYGYVMDPFNDSKFNKDKVEDIGSNVYRKDTAASETTANAYIGSNRLFFFNGQSGSGFFRFTLNELDSSGNGGVYVGLSNIKPENMGGDYSFNSTKIDYGIYAKNSASNYEFINSSGLTVSTLAPENFGLGGNDNDVLCIRASEGKIEGAIYSDTHPNGITLFSEDYNGTQQLYPIVGFYSQTNTSIRRLRYTPYDDEDDELYTATLDTSILQAQEGTPQPPTQDSGFKIGMLFKFPNLRLANFLGFNEEEIDLVADDVFSLTANNALQFTDKTEAYIVELLNLKLESFDGFKEERKNILALINNVRESTLDDVLYQSNNLVFLDLNNRFKQILRNIEIQIVNDEYQKVDIQGRANITILIKDKDEK